MSAASEASRLARTLSSYDTQLEGCARQRAVPPASAEEEVAALATSMQAHAEAVRPFHAELADALDFSAAKLEKCAERLGDLHRDGLACSRDLPLVVREAAMIATNALDVFAIAAQQGMNAASAGRVLH